MTNQFHPVANAWPLLNDAELKSLADDIAAHGLHNPIWRHTDGRIIDGRNRWLACEKASVDCPSNAYTGPDGRELVEFVVSMNDKRRHMDESQRAMVAAKIANLEQGGDRRSDQTANLQSDAVTQRMAADMLKVSERSVANARKVQSKGVPELAAAVEQGKIGVSTAAQVADAPAKTQRKLVEKGKKAMAQEVARRRTEKRASPRKPPKPRPNAMPQKPEHLGYLELWLRNGAKMVQQFGTAEQAVTLANQFQVYVRPDDTKIVCAFLHDLLSFVDVGQAA